MSVNSGYDVPGTDSDSKAETAANAIEAIYSPFRPPRLVSWLRREDDQSGRPDLSPADWMLPLSETNGKVVIEIGDTLIGYSREKDCYISRGRHDTERAMRRTGNVWAQRPERTWTSDVVREVISERDMSEAIVHTAAHTSAITRFDTDDDVTCGTLAESFATFESNDSR